MKKLIALARAIDALNETIGRLLIWLVLATALISAGNASIRYAFGVSSNGWLEIQWYLFAAIFLLGAAYTHKHNGHVRIDILYDHLSLRRRAWIDIFGTLFFLLPLCLLLVMLSWPALAESFQRHELSPDAGGLLRWPVRLMTPFGFLLLGLQGVAELIKRVSFLTGHIEIQPERPVEEV